MTGHECKQENLLGEMAANIENIKDNQAETKATTSKIFDAIDGKNGLVAKVEVHDDRFKTMPTPRSILIQASVWGGFTGAAIVLGKLVFFE